MIIKNAIIIGFIYLKSVKKTNVFQKIAIKTIYKKLQILNNRIQKNYVFIIPQNATIMLRVERAIAFLREISYTLLT